MASSFIFSSESVTEGHPDKVCDTISDSVLDACFEQDVKSRVACETMVKDNLVVLGGEISTAAKFDYREVVKAAIEEIGYTHGDCKFDASNFLFINALGQQSPDIAQGVDEGQAADKTTDEQGAGDQGIMFGYAVRETESLMPAPVDYSHRLGSALTQLRKDGTHAWLRPDSKTQVSIEYIDNKPKRITAVVISTQHSADITTKEIRELLRRDLIDKVLPGDLMDDSTDILINPTGIFIIGPP